MYWMVKRNKKSRRMKIMDKEYVDELKQLNAAISHYKKQLKAKPFKFYFSKEDSHDIAKRMIADKQERVKEIKSYYEK